MTTKKLCPKEMSCLDPETVKGLNTSIFLIERLHRISKEFTITLNPLWITILQMRPHTKFTVKTFLLFIKIIHRYII